MRSLRKIILTRNQEKGIRPSGIREEQHWDCFSSSPAGGSIPNFGILLFVPNSLPASLPSPSDSASYMKLLRVPDQSLSVDVILIVRLPDSSSNRLLFVTVTRRARVRFAIASLIFFANRTCVRVNYANDREWRSLVARLLTSAGCVRGLSVSAIDLPRVSAWTRRTDGDEAEDNDWWVNLSYS